MSSGGHGLALGSKSVEITSARITRTDGTVPAMGPPRRLAPLTPAEYLKIERTAEFRHEYFNGEIFAMSGGSPQHSLIKVNVVSELRAQLKGRPCTAFVY
ncbi:MAG: hypothetical protein JWM11_1131 [Planctomycetaceae bacterium]|nr:hypothetical protein [Planctomycetaceae bacterium]